MKVGIVGCGFIAGFHLPHILRRRSVESVSIADIDRQKAEEIARRFRLNKVYTDFEVMIREQRPDVVHILTPPATHAELAIRAIEMGCHVLVEKPMALKLEEAEAMVAAAKTAGVKLSVDHNNLWEPLMMRARNLVDEGRIGKVLHVDANYSFDIKRIDSLDANRNAKMTWLLGLPGGLLSDLLPHPVSILLHFLKEPVNIWVTAKNNGVQSAELPSELRALFSSVNATGFLSVSLGVKPDCIVINIYGTEMSIHVNLSNLTIVTRKHRDIPKKICRALDNIEQAVQLLSCTLVNGFKVFTGKMPLPDDVGSLITKFYESIENETEPPVSAEEGRAVVKVSQEILEQIVG